VRDFERQRASVIHAMERDTSVEIQRRKNNFLALALSPCILFVPSHHTSLYVNHRKQMATFRPYFMLNIQYFSRGAPHSNIPSRLPVSSYPSHITASHSVMLSLNLAPLFSTPTQSVVCVFVVCLPPALLSVCVWCVCVCVSRCVCVCHGVCVCESVCV